MMGSRLVIVVGMVLGLVGCGSSPEAADVAVMPDVVGLTLDVALSDIERADAGLEVEVLGGGTFGVVVESNWEVCDQLPAAGESLTSDPQLTVERSCESDEPDPTTPSTEPSSTPPEAEPDPVPPSTAVVDPTVPAPDPAPVTSALPSEDTVQASDEAPVDEPAALEILTIENNGDLAALLAESSSCDDAVAVFAAEYRGRAIEVDGNIAFVTDYDDIGADQFKRHPVGGQARFDILIYVGDYSETEFVGPSFRFTNVSAADLMFDASSGPDSIGTGDNLRITATVGEFTDGCLLLLDPVSTQLR